MAHIIDGFKFSSVHPIVVAPRKNRQPRRTIFQVRLVRIGGRVPHFSRSLREVGLLIYRHQIRRGKSGYLLAV